LASLPAGTRIAPAGIAAGPLRSEPSPHICAGGVFGAAVPGDGDCAGGTGPDDDCAGAGAADFGFGVPPPVHAARDSATAPAAATARLILTKRR